MSKRKTEDQINTEIAALVALKPKVRERTAFGDDNHAAIDAQLSVLRERMSSDEVYYAYGDEDADDGEQGDGAERDLRLARYWYNIAARNGDPAAPGKVKELDARAAAEATTAPP